MLPTCRSQMITGRLSLALPQLKAQRTEGDVSHARGRRFKPCTTHHRYKRRRAPLAPARASSYNAPVENTPIGPRRPRIHLAPTTRLGLWAVRLLVVFVAGLVVGMSLAGAGQIIGGEGAFDSLWLTVPLTGAALTAIVAGLVAGVAAAFAIVRRGERSVLAFLPIIVLVFFAVFLVGELGGHE